MKAEQKVGRGMDISEVSISELKEDPNNARIHNKRNLEKIRHSLSTFGQQKPIVVNKDDVVICGNGTLAAAKELGWDTILVVHTELEDKDQIAYALADNRTSELGGWDDSILAEQIQELTKDGVDVSGLGWDEDEIALLVVPTTSEDGSKKEFEEITPDSLGLDNKCPKCGFEW